MVDFTYLSDEALANLGITTGDVVEAIEQAVVQQGEGRVWAAPKAAIIPGDGRYMMATLAVSDEMGITAVKSVMVSPDNAARNLPGINGAIMLLDSQTGLLVGVTDANWVTAVRTAGLSAVMAKRLANPESKSVAFIGCGVQARSHLDALVDLFPLQDIRVFGRGQANVDMLCEKAEGMGLRSSGSRDVENAVDGADIVVSSITLAYDVKPFIDAHWLKPGAFAAIADLGIPWIDKDMAAFSGIFVDDRIQEAAMEKPMVDPDLISGDLFSVLNSETPVRFDKDHRSAFVFRGMAIGDLAIAGLAYKRAMKG